MCGSIYGFEERQAMIAKWHADRARDAAHEEALAWNEAFEIKAAKAKELVAV